jgi:hypothetical protein
MSKLSYKKEENKKGVQGNIKMFTMTGKKARISETFSGNFVLVYQKFSLTIMM